MKGSTKNIYIICKRVACRQQFKQAKAHLFAVLNGFRYGYLTLIILFSINYLFANS